MSLPNVPPDFLPDFDLPNLPILLNGEEINLPPQNIKVLYLCSDFLRDTTRTKLKLWQITFLDFPKFYVTREALEILSFLKPITTDTNLCDLVNTASYLQIEENYVAFILHHFRNVLPKRNFLNNKYTRAIPALYRMHYQLRWDRCCDILLTSLQIHKPRIDYTWSFTQFKSYIRNLLRANFPLHPTDAWGCCYRCFDTNCTFNSAYWKTYANQTVIFNSLNSEVRTSIAHILHDGRPSGCKNTSSA